MPVLPSRKAFIEEWLKTHGNEIASFDLVLSTTDAEHVEEDEDRKSESSSDSDSDSEDSNSEASAGDNNAVEAVIPSETTDATMTIALPEPSTLVSITQANGNLGAGATAAPSSTIVPAPAPVGASTTDSKANTGPIAAAVVASLIGAALLGLFFYVRMVKRRRANKQASFSAYTFNTPQPPPPPPVSAPQYTPSVNIQAPSVSMSQSQNPEMRESYYDKFPRSPSFIQEPPPVATNPLSRKPSKWSDRLSIGSRSFARSEVTVRGGRMVEFPSGRV